MIEFKSVSKNFGDTKAVTYLDLVVPSSGITVFVGPSGCGKTTTLRMINRMIEPSSGEIVWDGTPITKLKKTVLRRSMGYVIQNAGLFPHRTIIENVATVPGLLGWPERRAGNRAHELLDLVGLSQSVANRFPAQLSGGQQQRVGVARALAADPDLLLMDEPFSAVDPVVRSELRQLVRQLQRDLDKTVVLITHDMEEAITMGDQIAVLRTGGILAQYDTPQEILDNPADDFVADFVGRERGYRGLTLTPATGLPLQRVRTVRNVNTAFDGHDDEVVLVLDDAARPAGWADPKRPGKLLGLGSVFEQDTAMLRDVLEAALTSPVGLAVGTGKDGRYAGVIEAGTVMDRIRGHRATVAENQAARRAEAEERRRSAAPSIAESPTGEGKESTGSTGSTKVGADSEAEQADGTGDVSDGSSTDSTTDGTGPAGERR